MWIWPHFSLDWNIVYRSEFWRFLFFGEWLTMYSYVADWLSCWWSIAVQRRSSILYRDLLYKSCLFYKSSKTQPILNLFCLFISTLYKSNLIWPFSFFIFEIFYLEKGVFVDSSDCEILGGSALDRVLNISTHVFYDKKLSLSNLFIFIKSDI